MHTYRIRKDALRTGKKLYEEGKDAYARKKLKQGLTRTPEITKQIIAALRVDGIDFIVSLGEADAQLAYLCRENYVQHVETEDSDMIAYQTPSVR